MLSRPKMGKLTMKFDLAFDYKVSNIFLFFIFECCSAKQWENLIQVGKFYLKWTREKKTRARLRMEAFSRKYPA